MHWDDPKQLNSTPKQLAWSKRPASVERGLHRDNPKRSGGSRLKVQKFRRAPSAVRRKHWVIPK